LRFRLSQALDSTRSLHAAKLLSSRVRDTRVPEGIPEMNHSDLPIPANGASVPTTVSGVIERVIAEVPAPRLGPSDDPRSAADEVARSAARNAAMLSGSLALPPGPLGMLTVLPDLYLIWKIQRQMVADIFALHGRTAELTATHMLYCLFRHMASHV